MSSAVGHIIEASNLAHDFETIIRRVFRQDLTQPGFTILTLPEGTDSRALRRTMVALKAHMSQRHMDQWGESLQYLSLGRFDQQTTTRLHLDGAPERSFLLLGYEASTVRSTLHIADFSCCARDLALSPAEFLRLHNPMFDSGAQMLQRYTIDITSWQEDRARIVVINNSIANPSTPGETYGVLHGASILRPDPQASRVINSTMIAAARFASSDPAMQVREFLSTDNISGQILG